MEELGPARLAEWVGAPILDAVEPYVWDASVDTIRHFARSYGDDNPLYSDPAYAAAGPWGRLVAPPLFPIAAGLPRTAPDDEAAIDLDRAGRSARQSVLADRWTLHRPIAEGVRLERERRLVDVSVERSTTDATERTTYTAGGVLYARHERTRRYETGAGAGARRPALRRKLTTYTPAEIAAIDAAYEAETRRGAEPRYAASVSAGDRLGQRTRGPVTITDLVAYRGGVGPGPLGGEPLKLAYLNRRQRPDVYTTDRRGVPDITERRHWDEDYAWTLGHPSAYDYSHTRLTWCSHLLTDWMGDGAWLCELSGSTTGPCYVGDTHVLDGVVTEVEASGDASAGGGGAGRVAIDIEARNQLGEITCRARAVVLLPAPGTPCVTDEQLAALAP